MNPVSLEQKLKWRTEYVLNDLNGLVQSMLEVHQYEGTDHPNIKLTPIEKIAFVQLIAASMRSGILGSYTDIKVKPQVSFPPYRVDFLVTCFEESFVVECDGHNFHEKTKEQITRDKKRDRFLQSLGMKVFRFSGSEIWNSANWIDDVVNEIEQIGQRKMDQQALSQNK